MTRAGGGDLGAAERAEAVERGDAEVLPQAPLGGGGIEHRGGQRRHGGAHLAPQVAQLLVVISASETSSSPGSTRAISAAAPGGSPRRRRTRRSRYPPRPARSRRRRRPPGERGQEIVAARIEKVFLRQRARRHQPHHVAADHRLRAALLRFGRVFQLLADGDAVAERDQALQVVVGGVDRHAAHGNIGTQMLAARGQRDAERPAGGLGVVEEQLVEIAHPVKQQASGLAVLISMNWRIIGVTRVSSRASPALASGADAPAGAGAFADTDAWAEISAGRAVMARTLAEARRPVHLRAPFTETIHLHSIIARGVSRACGIEERRRRRSWAPVSRDDPLNVLPHRRCPRSPGGRSS